MGILTKYLLRAHTGPFLFAFSALTGLLFLNAIAARMESLVGKGIGLEVVGEFLLLSLPHTVALTLPMAILVSVLYTFSDLTSGNEITAMAAGGIKPVRLMLPLLGVGLILALGMLYFNDEILPEANHDLKGLLSDLGKTTPTFSLEERVVNEIDLMDRAGSIFMIANEIDNATNELRGIVIHDLSDPGSERTTYAQRGEMAFNENQTDLYLTLYDGVVHEIRARKVGEFSRARFKKQIVPLRGMGNRLERGPNSAVRSDRELSLIQLQWKIAAEERELEGLRDRSVERSHDALDRALGVPLNIPSDGLRSVVSGGGAGSRYAPAGIEPIDAHIIRDDLARGIAFDLRQNMTQGDLRQDSLNRFKVEWHKKFSIAYACLAFVLLGAPVAVRYPRGGVGMVISVSVVIFAIYWTGLIGGENLADKGIAPPWLTMWAANILFTVLGVILTLKMGSETSTQRSGGIGEEILFRLSLVRQKLNASVGRT